MLEYLVKSQSRRRLLAALWLEDVRGSASELSRRARVSFATAYRELRAMERHGLVVTTMDQGVKTYAANVAHPLASSLRALVTWRGEVPAAAADEHARAELAELGAPVRSELDVARPQDVAATMARGAELARRDPAVARALPVVLFNLRNELVEDALQTRAREYGTSHALGFFCALAAKLGDDRKLAKLAETLRDHRVHDQPFFVVTTQRKPSAFPLARRWGFRMSSDEETFASMFRKFARVES